MQQVNHLSSMRERDASLFMAVTSAGVQFGPSESFYIRWETDKTECDCFNYQCVNV